jgi:hypothetical protein
LIAYFVLTCCRTGADFRVSTLSPEKLVVKVAAAMLAGGRPAWTTFFLLSHADERIKVKNDGVTRHSIREKEYHLTRTQSNEKGFLILHASFQLTIHIDFEGT